MKTIQILLVLAAVLQIGCSTSASVKTKKHGAGVSTAAGSSGVSGSVYAR